MKRVLFLCTGNYYRSRFAEIYFNWHAKQRGLAGFADSRGLALDPRNPGPISKHTVARLVQLGIPLCGAPRYPLSASLADFGAAHHVIAVKAAEHRPLMQSIFPALASSVEYWDVHDLDYANPESALPHLEREVGRLLDRLVNPGEIMPSMILPLSAATTMAPQIVDSNP